MSDNYYKKLGHSKFEELCRSLLIEVIGPGIKIGKLGKDKGKDATYKGKAYYPSKSDSWNGKWVFQIKFHNITDGVTAARKNLTSILKKELNKIVKYETDCNYYILMTNVPVTQSDIDKISSDIKPKYPKICEIEIWGYNKIKHYLIKYPYIRRNYLELFNESDYFNFHFNEYKSDIDNLDRITKRKEMITQRRQIDSITNSILNLGNYLISENNLSKWKEYFSITSNFINNKLIDQLDKSKTDIINSFNFIMSRFYYPLLLTSFKLKKWDRISFVFDKISVYLDNIKSLKREILYSIWIIKFRELYKSILLPFFLDLKERNYCEECYFSIISFCYLLIKTLDNSLDCNDGLYSYDTGLSIVRDIIIERIDNPREFYTIEDDNTITLPFSVMVKPLIDGIINTSNKLKEYQQMIEDDSILKYELNTIGKKITDLIFKVLYTYRDGNILHELRFTKLGYFMRNSFLLKNDDFLYHLSKFLVSTKPVGFHYIVESLIDTIANRSNQFDDEYLKNLFYLSINVYKKQREIYGRDSTILRILCLLCIEKINKKYQLRMKFDLAKILMTYSEMNLDKDYVYGFQIFGSILLNENENDEILSFLNNKIIEMSEIKITDSKKSESLLQFIYKRNNEIANYKLVPANDNKIPVFKPIDIKRYNIIGSLYFDRVIENYNYENWIKASKEITKYLSIHQ